MRGGNSRVKFYVSTSRCFQLFYRKVESQAEVITSNTINLLGGEFDYD